MPKPSKKGASNLADPIFKKAQAAAIVQRRIMGRSMAQIATEFGLSQKTIERRIDYAKRHNLLQDAAERVLNQLVPLAIDAYITALENGDVAAAKDVMFGTGILSKNNKAQIAPAQEAVEMTLAVYREQRKKAYVTADDESELQKGLVPAIPSGDAAVLGEILGPDDGSDDLSFERPEEWPAYPPITEDREDDPED